MRAAMAARTTSMGAGSPMPAAWLYTRKRWNCCTCSSSSTISLNSPMPVLVPYMISRADDLLLEHGAADVDALGGRRVELDRLAVAGDAHELLDGQ